jgi:hypothetical protein
MNLTNLNQIQSNYIIKQHSNNNFEYPNSFTSLLSEYGIRVSDQIWASLNRGKAILQNEDQLSQYLCSFGKSHHKKLQDAYIQLFKDLAKNPQFDNSAQIEIIDYGCGQGIASYILLNELNIIDFPIENISKITLIEPSKVALERADFFLKKSTKIVKINKYLNDINTDDIKTSDNSIKIHLFSNILDMAVENEPGKDFSIETLAKSIKLSQSKENYFVCVSVRNRENLDEFAENIMEVKLQNIKFISINNESIRRGQYPSWHRVHKIFKKRF